MTTTRKSHPIRIAIVTAVALAVLLGGLSAAGAFDSDSDGAGRGAAPPTTQPDGADDPAPAPGLPDGRHFGRIIAAYVGPAELVFDPMELFVGDAAVDAAREDGRPADEVGDFYIRDADDKTLSLPVDGDVTVTVVDNTGGPAEEGAPAEYGEFTRSADGSGAYWITVEDGFVVAIDEQYLP